MSICERIMNNHNGQVQLDNTSPSGSHFKLTFPKVEQTKKLLPTVAAISSDVLVS